MPSQNGIFDDEPPRRRAITGLSGLVSNAAPSEIGQLEGALHHKRATGPQSERARNRIFTPAIDASPRKSQGPRTAEREAPRAGSAIASRDRLLGGFRLGLRRRVGLDDHKRLHAERRIGRRRQLLRGGE